MPEAIRIPDATWLTAPMITPSFGAPPLAEPYRAQPEALGGLRLADHGAGIADTSRKHVGPKRRTAQPTVIHDAICSSVQYFGKGFLRWRTPLCAATSATGWARCCRAGCLSGLQRQNRPPSRSPISPPRQPLLRATVFFTAAWIHHAGVRHAEDLVLRAQAENHQLFTVPDAPRQAEVMQRLGAQGIRVPDIVGIERDAAVLGRRST